MFNTVRPQMAFIVAVATSALVALVGSFSVAGEPQETVIVRRGSDQIIEIIHADGTTTKIPPIPQFLIASPDGTKLVAPTQVPTAEAVKEGAKQSPSVTDEPQARVEVQRFLPPGQIITVLHNDGKTPLYLLNASDVPKIYREFLVVDKEYRLAEAERGNVKGTAAVGEPQKQEPKEAITVQRNIDQTIEIINIDGTTTKISPSFLPRILSISSAGTKLVSVAEVAAEAENENTTPPSNVGPPAGRPITPFSQSAQRYQPQPRFQVSPAGDSAILLDTVSGRTWLLYYPDKRILSRLNEARGKTWKEMPCIWLPLHRPETDAEIEQILARERALREASDKLRSEEQKKAEEERRKAFGIGGKDFNADGTSVEPSGE